VRILRGSIIEKSNQTWKLVGGLALLASGFSVMVVGLARLEHSTGFALTLLGMALGLGAAIATTLSIRCPACGARWLWLAVNTQEHLQWLNWLSAQHVCPRCGGDPTRRSAQFQSSVSEESPSHQRDSKGTDDRSHRPRAAAMNADSRLNQFQRTCIERLSHGLSAANQPSPEYAVVEGERENYVEGRVGRVEFWIYEEGINFVDGPLLDSQENHWIYEPQDYDSESALIEDSVGDFVAVVLGARERA
jgi:hypothetical protein